MTLLSPVSSDPSLHCATVCLPCMCELTPNRACRQLWLPTLVCGDVVADEIRPAVLAFTAVSQT